MYKTIFTLIFFYLLCNSTLAQNHLPFPTDSAFWSIKKFQLSGEDPNFYQCASKQYGLLGDTLIEEVKYNKLYHKDHYKDSFKISAVNYVAAIREDETQKVWVRMPEGTSDILYYDFALDSGDSFCFEYFGDVCYEVDFTQTQTIGGVDRKVIFFKNVEETWIEGIGSTSGWFEWKYTGTTSVDLKCYSEKQKFVYGDSVNCDCNIYTSIHSAYVNDNAILYPNPTTHEITIEYAEQSLHPTTIEIYSGYGIKVKTIEGNYTNSRIDLTDLTDGIYNLSLLENGVRQWTKTIIKISE